jgi:hypothetical protein
MGGNLSTNHIYRKKVDAATGQLFPIYDEGTNVVLLSGRGDTTIRIFELGPRFAHICTYLCLPSTTTTTCCVYVCIYVSIFFKLYVCLVTTKENF